MKEIGSLLLAWNEGLLSIIVMHEDGSRHVMLGEEDVRELQDFIEKGEG